MTIRNFFNISIALVLFAACGTNTSSPNDAAPPTEKNNAVADPGVKGVFETKCAVCHGADGTAGISNAANLQTSKLDSSAIVQIVSDGKGAMPSFKKEFNEGQIHQIATYVRSLRK